MAEFKLDIIASTENLTDSLSDLKNDLTKVGDAAKKSGKEIQESLNKNGTEKMQSSLKANIMTLVQYEQQIKRLRSELKQTFDPKVAKELKTQLDATTQSLISFEQETSKVTQTQKSLKAQLRENKEILSQLEDAGLDTTDTFTQLAIETGKLEDQIGDTNERIKFFASDTRGLDGLIASAKLATAAFSVGQGAAALFGAENEDVQKALLKVNAAMAILNGLQEIQQALQKSSAATIAIETALRKVKIFFLGQETVATTTLTTAQYAGIVAAKALRVALIATGIGAFVALIIFAASKMGAFGDSTEETTEKLKEQKKALEEYYAELRKEADIYEKNKNTKEGGLNDLRRELELLKARGATQEEIFRKEQEIRRAELANIQYRKGFLMGIAEDELQLAQDVKDKKNEIQAAETEFLKAETDKRVKATEDELRRRRNIVDTDNANRIAAMTDGKEKELEALKEAERKELREAREQGFNLNLIRAKFAKERTEITMKYVKIEEDRAKEIQDILAKNMFVEDDTDKKILQNKLKYLDDLQDIKNLELDIEFESGDKSIEETRRIAKAKLDLEIEFAQKRLELLRADNLLGANDKAIKELELSIKKAQNEIAKLGDDKNPLLDALGLGEVTPEQLDGIKQNLNTVVNSIKSIISEGLEQSIDSNRNYIDDLNAQIDEIRDNIDKQKQLQLEGQANTLDAERENLHRLEDERRKALERDKQLQREKLNIDAATQLSSLITASANIFKAYSTLPVVGQALSIAAITAMFAAFALSQVRARQAISQQTLGKGGKIKGERHDASGWGGERFVSEKGNETYLEDGEWVINRKSSQKYDKILEAINKDRLFDLLSGTGVSLSEKKLGEFKSQKSSFQDSEIKHRIKLENELGNKKIDEFKQSFEKYTKEKKTEVTFVDGYRIEKKGNRTIKTKLNG